jgi:multiple sugar transport system ATP-binding protein
MPVLLTESMGSDLMVHARLDGVAPVVTEDMRETVEEIGTTDPALSSGVGHQATTITARLAPDAVAVEGQTLALAVDVERLHFFDPQTEKRIG